MQPIKTYETYWECDTGRRTPIVVKYSYYPGSKGARNSMGYQIEPDEDGQVEIVNIRTADGQDPTIGCKDWDRTIALEVLQTKILEEIENG